MKRISCISLLCLIILLLGLSSVPPSFVVANDNRDKKEDNGDDKNKDKEKDHDKDKDKDKDKEKDKDKDKDHSNDRDRNTDNHQDNDSDKPKPPTPPPPTPPPVQPPTPTPPPKKKGRLEEFVSPYKKKEKKHNDDDNDRKPDYYSSYGSHDDDDDEWNNFWGQLLFGWIPEVCGWIFFGDHGYRYSAYPYHDSGQKGIYVVNNANLISTYDPFAFQLHSYYQKVDNDLWSYGVYSKLLFPSGANLDTNYMRFIEKIDDRMDGISYLSLHYNFGAFGSGTSHVIDLGVGGGFLTDINGVSHGSASFQTRLDYFPKKPWSIHVSAAYSKPEGKSLYNLNATLGWHAGPLELFTGYHSFVNKRADTLDGPVFGAALWF